MNITYTKVIDVLTDERSSYEWKKMCIEFAKRYPQKFLESLDSPVKDMDPHTFRLAEESIRKAGGKKVQSIKEFRNLASVGLIESKNTIEKVADYIGHCWVE